VHVERKLGCCSFVFHREKLLLSKSEVIIFQERFESRINCVILFLCAVGSKDDIKFEPTKRKKIRVEAEDVTTITEGKVMVTKRGSVRVFATNGAEVKAVAVTTKKSTKTQSKTAKQQRKRKSVPILVPAFPVVDGEQYTSEIKEEDVDEESPVLKKPKKSSDGGKQKSNKINTKKVAGKENSKTKNMPKKSGVLVDLKVEEIKEEEATENVNPKSLSKTGKVRKPVKAVSQKRVLDSEPVKKKRKVL